MQHLALVITAVVFMFDVLIGISRGSRWRGRSFGWWIASLIVLASLGIIFGGYW